jgi:hypothetical protein
MILVPTTDLNQGFGTGAGNRTGPATFALAEPKPETYCVPVPEPVGPDPTKNVIQSKKNKKKANVQKHNAASSIKKAKVQIWLLLKTVLSKSGSETGTGTGTKTGTGALTGTKTFPT